MKNLVKLLCLLLLGVPVWAQNINSPSNLTVHTLTLSPLAGGGATQLICANNSGTLFTSGGCTGGGVGTVTNFSAGNLSPLFTTTVTNPTTTPALAFTLSSFAADRIFGNFTGGSAAPSTQAIPSCASDGTHALVYPSHTLTCATITGGGGGSGTVTPSPQFQIPYYSAAGTSNVLTGDAGITTDGSGNLSEKSIRVADAGSQTINGTPVNSSIITTNRTDGLMLYLQQSGSAYNGINTTAIGASMNYGGTGIFSGNFMTFWNNGAAEFNVSSVGQVFGQSFKVGNITGSTQCVQADLNGNLSGTGAGCGGSGTNLLPLNNTWTGTNTFNNLVTVADRNAAVTIGPSIGDLYNELGVQHQFNGTVGGDLSTDWVIHAQAVMNPSGNALNYNVTALRGDCINNDNTSTAPLDHDCVGASGWGWATLAGFTQNRIWGGWYGFSMTAGDGEAAGIEIDPTNTSGALYGPNDNRSKGGIAIVHVGSGSKIDYGLNIETFGGATTTYGIMVNGTRIALAAGEKAENLSAKRKAMLTAGSMEHGIVISGTNSTGVEVSNLGVGGVPYRYTQAHPTTCSATGAGAGGTCTLEPGSNDLGGVMIITAGTGAAASGALGLAFSQQLGKNPPACVLNYGGGTEAWTPTATLRVSQRSTLQHLTGWANSAVPLKAGTSYEVAYICHPM